MTYRRWRLLFCAALIYASVMAVIPHPPQMPGEPNDKVQHVIAFTTLAILARLAFPTAPKLRLLAGLSLYGALIEVVQLIPSLHRDGDVLDWIADTAAVAIVLALFRLARR